MRNVCSYAFEMYKAMKIEQNIYAKFYSKHTLAHKMPFVCFELVLFDPFEIGKRWRVLYTYTHRKKKKGDDQNSVVGKRSFGILFSLSFLYFIQFIRAAGAHILCNPKPFILFILVALGGSIYCAAAWERKKAPETETKMTRKSEK